MLTDFIHRYEGVFSKEDCQEIIDYIKFLENDGDVCSMTGRHFI